MSSAAIFIRSYAKDFPWLQYCLRSIQKYSTGFSEVIVAVPEQDVPLLKDLTAETVIGVHDVQPGYLGQQISKLTADHHTQADFILHFDSDCVFTKPVTPAALMVNGYARWLYTPWEELDAQAKRTWYGVMAKCLLESPPYEFMRKACIIAPRWAYAAFRGFIQATHGMSMEDYVLQQPSNQFSEFNCLGFYLWLHHRNEIEWHDTRAGLPDYGEIQHWSWSGISPNIRKQLEGATA